MFFRKVVSLRCHRRQTFINIKETVMDLLQAWPVWGLIVTMVTVLYVFWPSRFLKKNEYVLFFSISFSAYYLLMAICHICLGGFQHETDIPSLFFLFLAPWICITHFLYPFKHTKRNPHFTFFITAFAILEILLIAVVWILVQFSNM